jgi:cytochrome P450
MAAKAIYAIIAGLLLCAIYFYQRQRSHDGTARSHGCSSVARYPVKEPFVGLDFHLKMHMEIPSVYRYHQRYGKTFEIRPLVTQPAFATIDPANIRAISIGKEWGVEGLRLAGAEYFCGRGFLMSDGDIWQRSRKLLKPTFAKNNLQDLGYLSQQVDDMFAQLPGDGTTVDLQPLFYTMVCHALHYTTVGHLFDS